MEGLFVDLGSGRGRAASHVALATPLRARGVELDEARHAEAAGALAAFAEVAPAAAAKVELRLGDAATADLAGARVVFLNSLCFPAPVLRALVPRLASAPAGALVLSVRALPTCARGLHLLGYVAIETTWNPSIPVFAKESNEFISSKFL